MHVLRRVIVILILLGAGVTMSMAMGEATSAIQANLGLVVQIKTLRRGKIEVRDEFAELRSFLDPSDIDQSATSESTSVIGSGFVVGSNGYILTSSHALSNSKSIKVKMPGVSGWKRAKLLREDKRKDIALIKIKANDLISVKFGTSSLLQPGQTVLTIGSPFGFEGSASSGIISALNRKLKRAGRIGYIQTDVATNPGNSGGPLINLDGEVIGMITQIYTKTGGYQGVSFAVPVEHLIEIVELIK